MQQWIEKYFQIGHDAAASVLIALITFIVGYIITALVYGINRFLERRSNRKIFFHSLKGLNKSLKRQEKGFIETIDSLNVVENSPWRYSKVELFQISVFREMGYRDTFKSFFVGFENQLRCVNRNLKRKAFNKAWENVNITDFWLNKSFEDFYPTLDRYNEFGERRSQAIEKLSRIWISFFEQSRTTPSNDVESQYLKALDAIISNWQKLPTGKRVTPFNVQRSLILKIKILNKKYPYLPLITDFDQIASDASHQYHQMELIVRHFRDQFKEYRRVIRNVYRTNEKILEILA